MHFNGISRMVKSPADDSFFIHSHSCTMARWWPGFRVKTSCHVIQLFAKSVLVVTENTDRYYENCSIFEDKITIIPTYASFVFDSTSQTSSREQG